jgi:putative PIN family toxin of toxin-antitoxin system
MKCVLDTNVVIDWLVFDDPFMTPLREGARSGVVTVLTHRPALDELRRVLTYPALKLDSARQSAVFERYLAQTSMWPAAESSEGAGAALPKGFPRCRDSDDDPFLALAYHACADALVSRDKAVLKLKRRVRRFGFEILNVPEMIAALV